MLFHNQPVQDEFFRWKAMLPQDTCMPGSLSCESVLEAHFVLVDMFYGRQAGLGGIGPKSLDLLMSAVARQDVCFGGIEKWSRPEEKAATLMFGIISNHPFHDANKRTSFLSTMMLLKFYRLIPKITAQQFEDFTVVVAEKSFRKFDKYKISFADREDADVLYIAHFLKSAVRQADRKDYIVTFREISQILRRFGFEMRDPQDNHIDIFRLSDNVRVGNVGFPGWSRQCTKATLKHIRRLTELTILDGVDSGAFFKGEIPVNNLLAKYYEPLERLAFR